MFKLIKTLLLFFCIMHTEAKEYETSLTHRELRGGRGGGGRGGSRSSRSSSYGSSRYSRSSYYKTYSRYTGSFYGGRSYGILYVYYLPPNYYTAIGFYSPVYLMAYYNGYGYNFYYGAYGYYQDSSNAAIPAPQSDEGEWVLSIIFIFVLITCSVLERVLRDEE